MFETLKTLNADPILGLMAEFRNDPREQKIDLAASITLSDTLSGVELFNRPLSAQAEKSGHTKTTRQSYLPPKKAPAKNITFIPVKLRG